jgi:hypothetical protein
MSNFDRETQSTFAACFHERNIGKVSSEKSGVKSFPYDTGSAPKFIVQPTALTHAQVSGMFVLSCQAIGSPVPRVTWLRDGLPLPVDANFPRRIAAFESGESKVSICSGEFHLFIL